MNSYTTHAYDTLEALWKEFEATRKDIVLYDQRQAEIRAAQEKRDLMAQEKKLGMLAFDLGDLVDEERDKRAKRRILEEKVRRSIAGLFEADLKQVKLIEDMRKIIKAEAAKRICIERHEEKDTMEFTARFRKMPWKPTLWVLGNCPFVDKTKCPFTHGLCHGLNVPPKHYAEPDEFERQSVDALECSLQEMSVPRLR